MRREGPAYALWWEWYSAHHEVSRLGRIQARLETKLLSMTDSPRVELLIAGRENPVAVRTEQEVDRWLAGESLAAARVSAKAQLIARRNAWEAADAEVGFSAAKRAEAQAMAHDEDVASRLWRSQADSTIGVIGKMHALLTIGQPSPDTDEFPWPQLRLILADLMTIDGTGGRRR
ncbi:hypothetical protein FHT86_007114 [Rhizobium sp. BK313]|uniref:hypothetical protein n=1 Tax=Rhizobium sp. BK313 TaxID=2587081 RepID=UPI00105B6FF7|nr:hypothetical protein [Rhizobium sp. BK313]MBB3458788.1 hypothetical protein [Rhizobium sp. BK313]